MKHLLYKVKDLFHRFYLHLSVVLTLGIRGSEKNKGNLEHNEECSERNSQL